MFEYTGQIGLIPHPQTLVEYGIEWVTDSPVFHAVAGVSETECASAEPGGVRIRKISEYPDAYWSRFDLADLEREAIVAKALSMLGTHTAGSLMRRSLSL